MSNPVLITAVHSGLAAAGAVASYMLGRVLTASGRKNRQAARKIEETIAKQGREFPSNEFTNQLKDTVAITRRRNQYWLKNVFGPALRRKLDTNYPTNP